MSDQLPSESKQTDPGTGRSCSTSGGGCPACGGGKLLLLLFAGLLVAYLVANRRTPAAPSAVAWVNDYDKALATAAETQRPVLLAFKATWCAPCRTMDNEVFAKDAAAKALSGWVPVHVDVDQQDKIANKYEISGVPTFVALSPSGREIARTSGGMSLAEFAQFLAAAEAKLPAPTAKAG